MKCQLEKSFLQNEHAHEENMLCLKRLFLKVVLEIRKAFMQIILNLYFITNTNFLKINNHKLMVLKITENVNFDWTKNKSKTHWRLFEND